MFIIMILLINNTKLVGIIYIRILVNKIKIICDTYLSVLTFTNEY